MTTRTSAEHRAPADADFKKEIRRFYRTNRRDLPWRPDPKVRTGKAALDPYRVFVSEVMLQQTQVSRVIPKYAAFIKKFPTFKALAAASLSAVLAEWKGLGYNRRALNLKRAAEKIVAEYGGKLPREPEALKTLPGIGPNTAGSIAAFAFDAPAAFIETNVRSVYIHFYFQDRAGVRDKELLPVIERTLDRTSPREWYYALMDYGSTLKKSGNPSRRSAHYARQSPFKGSRREKRANILALVVAKPGRTVSSIARELRLEEEEADSIAHELMREGFLVSKSRKLFIFA